MTQVAPESRPPRPYRGNIRAESRPSPERAAAAARVLRLDPTPIPPEPGERHLRVVRQPQRRLLSARYRGRVLLVGAIAVALAVAFSLVYLHVLLAQRQFRLDKISGQLQQDQTTYQKLRLNVAELDSPQNIISTAEGKLGMVPPTSIHYLAPSVTVPGASSASVLSSPSGSSGQAPAGDADWPLIKSQLAGSP